MTFGEKIQRLRKESGLSQEELSDQLGVSRQAISKWERDSGYPETEKIVCMSKIFHVTLDYLLNEEAAQSQEVSGERGTYVSREMAEGFLLYQKRKVLKIAIAVGAMIGSLAFSFVLSDISMVLFILVMIVGIVLLCSVKLTDNPYGKLWHEPLVFDKAVKAELTAAYTEKKNKLKCLNLIGIALIAMGLLFFPILVPVEYLPTDANALAAGMLAAGAGTFLCIYMSGLARAYRLLVMNEEYQRKGT